MGDASVGKGRRLHTRASGTVYTQTTGSADVPLYVLTMYHCNIRMINAKKPAYPHLHKHTQHAQESTWRSTVQ